MAGIAMAAMKLRRKSSVSGIIRRTCSIQVEPGDMPGIISWSFGGLPGCIVGEKCCTGFIYILTYQWCGCHMLLRELSRAIWLVQLT